ncbi:enoyl-CoA hydratase/isomerase family protein [Rhodococcus artemisiae]|uniref:Enoyl-CoA hydratase/isomerase family protein n=1 Tax=Rhodococcus artemisiae TaxID=714159 RepID=A0ABU7LBT8_9NOCA|nr:enoyl-CoA hydratase/isomerase family protein [Rhodococcus artemisiae]MEE2059011.1 enoyl-CoA hydratase/isomerase family protein [Rhodococcus artemisiae]
MNEHFSVTRTSEGTTALFTITRPERANALSHQVIDGLRTTVEYLPDGCDALVIMGSPTVFSAGADLGCVRGKCHDSRPIQPMLDELTAAIETAPFPVVALIEGPCVGAAVELSLTCDARIGTADASFRIPATEIGTVYRAGGVENLYRRLPFVALQSMLLLGSAVSAEKAQAWGLIDTVDGRKEALKTVDALVDRIRPRPQVFAAQKASLGIAARVISLSDEAHRQITDIRNENSGRPAAHVEERIR